MDALARSDGLKVKFDAVGGEAPAPVEIRPMVRALERPLFQYAYQIADDRGGNGDGRVQKGEQVTMYLTVKNVGKGRSYETQANLANLSGDGLFLHNGRFDISNMMPGDVRRVAFTFDVQPQLADQEATLSLSVGDRDLKEFASEKVKIPVEPKLDVAKASGLVKAVTQGAVLLPTPDLAARGFGRLAPGSIVAEQGKTGDFVRVDLGGGRFAFVSAKDVAPASGSAPAAPTFEDVYTHAPPLVEVSASAVATKDDKVKITGSAVDSSKIMDAYIFVGSRKLYYKSNRDGADPKKLAFEFDAPLRPGVNVVTVVARETPDTVSTRRIVVRKDGPDGSILKTPKSDDPIADNDAGGDE
jgi:carboxyl-terminal processing protease